MHRTKRGQRESSEPIYLGCGRRYCRRPGIPAGAELSSLDVQCAAIGLNADGRSCRRPGWSIDTIDSI